MEEVALLTEFAHSPMAIARARHALTMAGVDAAVDLTPASSVTNEVWMSDQYVVRVNRRPNQRLRREAILGPQLPNEVGYPTVVAYGGHLGADWLVVERVPGMCLSRWWPDLSEQQREKAITELAQMLKVLHQTPAPPDLPAIDSPQMLRTDTLSPVMSLLVAIDQCRSMPYVDSFLMNDVERLVYECTSAIEPFRSETLVHGDLTFENILYDGQNICAILDFEWARRSPSDVDLDVLMRFTSYPELHVADDYVLRTHAADYAQVPWWLASAYPELFSIPRQIDRLRLYAIAYDMRDLTMDPPQAPANRLNPLHALNRLRNTIEGRSHLDVIDRAVAAS